MRFLLGLIVGGGVTALATFPRWEDPAPWRYPVGPDRLSVVRLECRAAAAERAAARAVAEACDLTAELARRDAVVRDLRARLDAARRGAVGPADPGPNDLIPPQKLPER